MKTIIYIILFSFFSQTLEASVFLEASVGGSLRDLKGDQKSYDNSFAGTGEAALGFKGERWRYSLESSALFGRQGRMTFDYEDTVVDDEFNWLTFRVGPTLAYEIKSRDSDWSYIPFVGVFYSHSNFTNSVDLTDDQTGRTEDSEHQSQGVGTKIGVNFETPTASDSWFDGVQYRIYASYSKHGDFEGDYKDEGRIKEFKGDTPDNLEDYSIGFSIGLSLGDKLWNKTKDALGIF